MDDYIQFGCGWCAPKEWINFDASPTLRYERIPVIGRIYTKNRKRFPPNVKYGNIVKGLPISEDSCRAIYCSHVLEHLTLYDFRNALKNVHNILKTDGIFRLVLPDLEYYIQGYQFDASPNAAIRFMTETGLGVVSKSRTIPGFFIEWFGLSRHLWMWDFKSLEYELTASGFTEIKRVFFGDSTDPMFLLVEDPDRWENCLGIECQKKN